MKISYLVPTAIVTVLALLQPVSVFALPKSTASSTARMANTADRLAKEKETADNAVTKRLDDLNNMLVKISDMNNVSSMFTDHMKGLIDTEKDNLTTLKTQIDSESSTTALKSEIGSITKSFRIYALVIPQEQIAAASDRIKNIGNMLSAVGDKISSRLAQNTFADTTAIQNQLTDFKSQISNASSLADQAISITAPLQPDNGDKTALTANTTALKQARGYLKNAQQDVKTARKDLTDMLKSLKSLSATSSIGQSATSTQ